MTKRGNELQINKKSKYILIYLTPLIHITKMMEEVSEAKYCSTVQHSQEDITDYQVTST